MRKKAIIDAVKSTDKLTDTVAHVHTADCEDEHDHLTVSDKKPQSKKALPKIGGPNFNRIYCDQPVASVTPRTRAELDKILKEYNVTITSEISNEQFPLGTSSVSSSAFRRLLEESSPLPVPRSISSMIP